MSDTTNPTDPGASRRAFLGRVARKAAYVAPAVLAISTRRADAMAISCLPNGSPCTSSLECCSFDCNVMMAAMGKCRS